MVLRRAGNFVNGSRPIRDAGSRSSRIGRSSISSIRSLSWASPLNTVTDVAHSGYRFGFVHQAHRLTTASSVNPKEEREPTLAKSEDAAVDTTTKTTRTNRRGNKRGVVTYEKQVGIHDPKYAEQRSEWSRKAGKIGGVVSYEKQAGFHDPKYAEQRKEWSRKAGEFAYEKQVGIHDPKYAEQRSEWSRKAGKIGGVVGYEKQLGVHDPKYAEQRSEWSRKGGKISGVLNHEKQLGVHDPKYAEQRSEVGRQVGIASMVHQRGIFDPYNVTDCAAGRIHRGTANRARAVQALEKKLPGISEEVERCVRYQELSKELRRTISQYKRLYINECNVPAELFFDALRPHLLRLENLPRKVEAFLEDLPSMRKEELWRRRNRARRAANGNAFHANARLVPLFRETAMDENDHDGETHTKQGHVPQPAGLFPARLWQAWELSADRLDALECAYGRNFGDVGATVDARRKDFLTFIGCKTETDMPASNL